MQMFSSSGFLSLPIQADLFQTQQAKIQYLCSCGTFSGHVVYASVLESEGLEGKILEDEGKSIHCPGCQQQHFISFPQVIHDDIHGQVWIRLPESFRVKAFAALSWWFAVLQESSRDIIPSYATHPQISFLAPESYIEVEDEKIVHSSPSLVDASYSEIVRESNSESELLSDLESENERFETHSSLEAMPLSPESLKTTSPSMASVSSISSVKKTITRHSSQFSLPSLPSATGEKKKEGIWLFPEFEFPKGFHPFAQEWPKQESDFYFGYDPQHQRCTLNLLLSLQELRDVNREGCVPQFYLQLHRLPNYAILSFVFLVHDANQEMLWLKKIALDIENPGVLLSLDSLMQDFSLRLQLCESKKSCSQELEVLLPLEMNLELLLQKAREWNEQRPSTELLWEVAKNQFLHAEFQAFEGIQHPLKHESYLALKTPQEALQALETIEHWSSDEPLDFLICKQSFPLTSFVAIQKRVLTTAVRFGLAIPLHMIPIVLELELAESSQHLAQILLSHFTELCLQISQTNDLSVDETSQNWKGIFDICSLMNVSIDPEVFDLAQKSQAHSSYEEIVLENAEDIEMVEDFKDFKDFDEDHLIQLLSSESYRLDATQLLATRKSDKALPSLTSLLPSLSDEEKPLFFRSFLLYGKFAEPAILEWLEDKDDFMRMTLLSEMSKQRFSLAIPRLIQFLNSRKYWEQAIEGLCSFGEKAIPALEQCLQDDRWLMRLRAVQGLIRLAHPKAKALLPELAEDPNELVRSEIENWLGKQ